MKRLFVLCVALLLIPTACNDSERKLPTLTDDWKIARISVEWLNGTDFPRTYEVSISVERVGAAGSPPDGMSVAVDILFPDTGAQQSLDVKIFEGVAVFELVFEQPGVAECTAKVGGMIADFKIWVVVSGESSVTT